MGLLTKIFPKREKAEEALHGYFRALTAYQPVFTSYEGGLYEMEITRAAIHAFALAASKLQPETKGAHAIAMKNMLAYRPNPWMDTTKFLYRLATILAVNNTAFIAPLYDPRDMETIVGYFPVLPEMCEIKDADGEPWLSYTFSGGQRSAVELNRAGVLTQMQYRSDFFGDSNRVLQPTMQLLHTQREGIREGIKNSAAIRFLAKLAMVLDPEDIAQERRRFASDNLSSDNNGGVMMFDSKYSEVRQIDSKPFVVDANQMKLINESVFNFFGVNEQILRNNWQNSLTWQAFYEGKVEPFAVQLGLVMTNMTFTPREISCGNEILFSSNRLQYATNQEKLETVVQLFDRGMLSTNQGMQIFNLPPVEGGDERYIRGEYINVKERQPARPAQEGGDGNAGAQ